MIASPTHYRFQVVREGITFLTCTQVEMPPLMAIEFLCRVANVLSDYLGGLNEDVIKDNFVIVYEVFVTICYVLIGISWGKQSKWLGLLDRCTAKMNL